MKVELRQADRALSEHMRAIAARLTPEQRKANGRKAWATRRENLAAKLAQAATPESK